MIEYTGRMLEAPLKFKLSSGSNVYLFKRHNKRTIFRLNFQELFIIDCFRSLSLWFFRKLGDCQNIISQQDSRNAYIGPCIKWSSNNNSSSLFNSLIAMSLPLPSLLDTDRHLNISTVFLYTPRCNPPPSLTLTSFVISPTSTRLFSLQSLSFNSYSQEVQPAPLYLQLLLTSAVQPSISLFDKSH